MYYLRFINLFVSLLFRCFKVYYNLWSDHVLGWWKHRNEPNVLFLKYEDLKTVCYVTAEHFTISHKIGHKRRQHRKGLE